MRSDVVAVREEEDLAYVLYGSASGFFIKRKSDGKVMAMPWTPETNELHQKIRGTKRTFIGDALEKYDTSKMWRSPRSLGLKRTDADALYAV